MEKKKDYERMYQILADYEQKIHEKNQRRIRIGIKCVIIVPLIFLNMLFWIGGSKIIYLTMWIASMFLISAYLIVVEYMDYQLQEKLRELNDEEHYEIHALIGQEMEDVERKLRLAKPKKKEEKGGEPS